MVLSGEKYEKKWEIKNVNTQNELKGQITEVMVRKMLDCVPANSFIKGTNTPSKAPKPAPTASWSHQLRAPRCIPSSPTTGSVALSSPSVCVHMGRW